MSVHMTPSHPRVDTKLEVDLLVRKSKIVREGEHALSLRAQEERGRRWADENGYSVRHVWKENLSAYSDVERPKYDAAMKAVLNGEVPALWCYALDRFSRKGARSVIDILDGGHRVVFDYEDLDTSRPRDRRWILQRAEDAREYSERLSYNVRTTKTRQRNEGRWLARAPFGLVADRSTRKLSPNTAKLKGRDYSPWDVVCRIYREIADGTSARALARRFNEEGIRSSTGKAWRADSIRAIVIHPAYEGWLTESPGGKSHKAPVHYLNDGKRVRCAAEGVTLISAELAQRARHVLSGHLIIDNKPRPGRAKALLAGRLRCAGCGNAMVADGRSYNCQLRASGGACAAPASVWRASIERYVADRWLSRMGASDPEDPVMIAAAARWTALTRPQETTELREAIAALKEAKAVAQELADDFQAGLYSGAMKPHYVRMVRETDARKASAEERVAALSGGTIDVSFILNGDAPAFWEGADEALRRDLIGLAIDRITVSKAPKQGVRFDGYTRCDIQWAAVEDESA